MTLPSGLSIQVGAYSFKAVLLHERAPRSCEAFLDLLPMREQIIHVRWSGEAMWIPFGEAHVSVPWEDPTSYPPPGQFLLYPGGVSEMEILLPYGACQFASKAGQLAGNPFAQITEGAEQLYELGRHVLYAGVQEIRVEAE